MPASSACTHLRADTGIDRSRPPTPRRRRPPQRGSQRADPPAAIALRLGRREPGVGVPTNTNRRCPSASRRSAMTRVAATSPRSHRRVASRSGADSDGTIATPCSTKSDTASASTGPPRSSPSTPWSKNRSNAIACASSDRSPSAIRTVYPRSRATCSAPRRKGRNTGLARSGTSTPIDRDSDLRNPRARWFGR